MISRHRASGFYVVDMHAFPAGPSEPEGPTTWRRRLANVLFSWKEGLFPSVGLFFLVYRGSFGMFLHANRFKNKWPVRALLIRTHWRWFWGARDQLLAESTSRIQFPPGWRLRVLARFVVSRRVFELVFEPTLRDMFDEYCQALGEKQPWKARWVRVRGTWSFWAAACAQLPISLTKVLIRIWQAKR